VTAGTKWAWVSAASAAALAILIAPWRLLSTDAFLALVTGREIAEHGLPRVDELAFATHGHVWTDQQWLGQLAIYEMEHLAGLRITLVVQAIITGLAFAITAKYALDRGASQAATLVCGVAGFGIGATFFTLRPQLFSIVGFAVLLALLGEDSRSPSKKVWWAIPMMALWANVHGVVVMGAMFVGLRAFLGMLEGLRKRDFRWTARNVALGLASAASPFCMPYWRDLPRYLQQISHLQDPVRQLPILEWARVNWPSDWPFFAIFAAMTILLVVVHWKKLSRPAPFETLVLAITACASWQASRHLQWFGMALAAYGPLALDATPIVREGRVLGRVASAMRVVGPAVFFLLVVRLLLMKEDTLERGYSLAALPQLATTMRADPSSPVAVSDVWADWALWYVPELRGRLEADVRFELLDDKQAREMGVFLFAKPGWEHVYPEAKIVLVARKAHEALDKGIRAEPGAKVVWEDKLGTLVVRP